MKPLTYNFERLRPIETAYLYNSYDGSILIYDVKAMKAILGPATWFMSPIGAFSNDKIRV